jgi:hypothetical protein
MAGAAIIVSLQQLKGLLGIVHFTNKMQIFPVLLSVYKQKDEVLNSTMTTIHLLLVVHFNNAWKLESNFFIFVLYLFLLIKFVFFLYNISITITKMKENNYKQ